MRAECERKSAIDIKFSIRSVRIKKNAQYREKLLDFNWNFCREWNRRVNALSIYRIGNRRIE